MRNEKENKTFWRKFDTRRGRLCTEGTDSIVHELIAYAEIREEERTAWEILDEGGNGPRRYEKERWS